MKLKFFILTAAALLLLLGFSPWEGAAGVASNGELPVSGFFVATNSFPRNTVVDITNIETGRSTRAIVANTINNPGLLALLSRDVGEIIGLRQGAIGRIRIVSPSDPIAYQRFMDGLNREIPPFDSGRVVRSEDELLADVYGQQPHTPAPAQPAPSGSEFFGPSYLIEPEWGGSSRPEIVDIPRFTEPTIQVVPTPAPPPSAPSQVAKEPELEMQDNIVKNVSPFFTEQSPQDSVKPAENYYSELPQNETVKDVPPYTFDALGNRLAKDVPEYASESVFSEIAKDVEGFIVEESNGNIVKSVSGYNPESDYDRIAKDAPDFIKDTLSNRIAKDVPEFVPETPIHEIAKNVDGFILEETSNKIAKDVQGFESERAGEDIAKAIGRYDSERASDEIAKDIEGYTSDRELDELAKDIERFISSNTIDSVAKDVPPLTEPAPAEPGIEFNIVAAEERSPSDSRLYGIDPNDIIPGISQVRGTPAPPAAPPGAETSFSIRSINSLDRGQYYVQIASLPLDNVENTIRQFDPQFFNYNPVVFRDRDNSYRILIGPLNQGESAAILARFRSIGYRDALVRRGG